MGSQLPDSFTASIRELDDYPENLVYKSTYPDALRSYRIRLDEIEKKLFMTQDSEVNVPFRDLGSSGTAFEKYKVQSDDALQTCLGEASKSFPDLSAVRHDTICRFVFLYADHSVARLRITRKMLARLFTYYQVMPNYLEFLITFGNHKHSREQRFSGFRSETLVDGENVALRALGRPGNQFQLCYNLKAVARRSTAGQVASTGSPWSILQGAIYHRFDLQHGNSIWMITRAGWDIKQRIENMTGKTGRNKDRQFQTPMECLRSSLAVHLLVCHWSGENWRVYLQELEESVEYETYGVVYGPRGHDEPRQPSSSSHLQRAQQLEEQINEAIMVVKGNCHVLASLRDFYQLPGPMDSFPKKAMGGSELIKFATQIDNFIYDSNLQIERGRLLADNVAARKIMILQHLQSQQTEKMEKLTISMQRDSLTVRIIAFLTFLYLPATFVSTFFSTDIVKYQNQNPDARAEGTSPRTQSGSFSSIALNRWLQVTLPLTFFTFAAAIFWLRREDRKIKKGNQDLPTTEVKT